jgi:hypothetical protein
VFGNEERREITTMIVVLQKCEIAGVDLQGSLGCDCRNWQRNGEVIRFWSDERGGDLNW